MRKIPILLLSFFFVILSFCFLIQACKKSEYTTPPAVPGITDFFPKTDTVGAWVTITGSNFNMAPPGINIVQFNGIDAQVIASTTTRMTCVVPTGVKNG